MYLLARNGLQLSRNYGNSELEAQGYVSSVHLNDVHAQHQVAIREILFSGFIAESVKCRRWKMSLAFGASQNLDTKF